MFRFDIITYWVVSSSVLASLLLVHMEPVLSDDPIVYERFNGVMYALVKYPPSNWISAIFACDKAHGQLADFHDKEEHDFLVNLALQENAPDVWLGGSALGSDRRFTWLSSSQNIENRFWLTGEPNGSCSVRENCVQLETDQSPLFKLSDHNCNDLKPYICRLIGL